MLPHAKLGHGLQQELSSAEPERGLYGSDKVRFLPQIHTQHATPAPGCQGFPGKHKKHFV
jgi:hypothetical protein